MAILTFALTIATGAVLVFTEGRGLPPRIPANGFYEWEKQGKTKIPHHFHLKDDALFAFAGLWESWRSPEGENIDSCTIVTTDANDLVKPYHDRMPVILASDKYDRWLDPDEEADDLKELLKPYSKKVMTEEVDSKLVNSPKNEGPELMEA